MGKIKNWLNRTSFAVSQKLHVAAANTWRDSYNPLRSLTITRGVHLLEEGERGAYSNLQWLYRYIEMGDATYGALIERRVAAIKELDWDIRIPADLPEEKKPLAEAQQKHLQEVYTKIRNIKEAMEHLTMASFRGYSHLEFIRDDNGDLVELGVVPQWHWVRDGINGRWQYNANSTFGTHKGEDVRILNLDQDDSEIEKPELLAEFVVREVDRPIGRVALICFIRKGLSQKDWDGFIETYGIPAVFIIAPPELGKEQQEEFQSVAEGIASDARGTLPGGSDVKTVDNGARGVNPFADHIKYQDEQLVLRGTGGKLSMLTDATGMGSGASDTHSDTFDQIAKAEAQDISEFLQCAIDEVELEKAFPGQEQLAYFLIAANEETDTSAIVADVATLASAGYKVTPEYLLEKTGYEVHLVGEGIKEKGESEVVETPLQIANRESAVSDQQSPDSFLTDSKRLLDEARLKDLQPIREAFETALQTEDEEDFVKQLTAIDDALPETATPAQEAALTDILFTAVINGFGEVEEETLLKNNCGIGGRGFESGNKCNKSTKGTSREPKTKHKRDHFGEKPGQQMTPKQSQERLTKTLNHSLRNKVSINGAGYRKELGRIDLPWGTPGDKRNDFKGGKGISHALAKHGEAEVRKLPEVLTKGKIKGGQTNVKREIHHEGFIAVVVKDKQTSSWLLTTFDQR